MTTKSHIKTISFILLLALVFSSCSTIAPEPTATATSSPTATLEPTATPTPLPEGYVEYFTQSGDTLASIASHFSVSRYSIKAEEELDYELLLDPGTRLLISDYLTDTTLPDQLFPDSAVVFSPTSAVFDIQAFAEEQGGFLSTYSELMIRGTTPATDIIYELALEYSINPRILLALMEYESGWVTNADVDEEQFHYPFGWQKADRDTVYFQVAWTIQQLSQGYYGWRAGTLTELTFTDGTTLRLSPYLNAGTVAVMYSLAQIHDRASWEAALYGERNISDIHTEFFGDAFELSAALEPLFPAGLEQPEMNLPFAPNEVWNLTGGSHAAWGSGWSEIGVLAALDFAPPLAVPGCGNSSHFTTAAAAGLVVRAGGGVVVIDMDKDGYEQTGWVLVYMHVANSESVSVGDVLAVDDPVGHPSCEGGSSSGIHVHIARKYNGEWVLADGGLPFVLSGYRAYNGEKNYEGSMVNEEEGITVTANIAGNYWTRIYRPESREEFSYTPTPRN